MAYCEAFEEKIKTQIDEYIRNSDPFNAPDASTELAINHLPASLIGKLLEHISGDVPSVAEVELFDGGAKGLSPAEFLSIWKSDEARLLRLKQSQLPGHAPLDVVHHWEKYPVRAHERLPVDSPHLTVPDAEASDAALLGEAPAQGGGRVLESRFGVVRKLGQHWRKAWQQRWLYVEATMGFGYHTKPVTAADFNKERPPRLKQVIPFAQVVGVCIATAANTPGKAKLRSGCFNVTCQTGRTYTFACENDKEALEWCRSIASHVLVHAVKTKTGGLDRVRAFVEAGGELNGTFKKGNQYPLLATALATDAMDVAQYLLSIGADAKCLLRWNFLAGNEGVLTPVSTLHLLTSANYDLNIIGDDCHQWTLLHYLCYGAHLDEVDRILLPKLKDAFLDTPNTIGDTALTLVLKTISAGKQSIAAVEPIAIQIAQRCPNINHADSAGDNALHLAIKLGCADLARVMVEMGADTRVRDSHGNTALHLAIKTQQPALVNLIASHAARVGVVPRTHRTSSVVSVESVPVAVAESTDDGEEGGDNVHAAMGTAAEQQETGEELPMASDHRGLPTPTAGVAALLDQRDGAFGDTALVMSIKLGQEEMACMLVRNGASPMRGSNMWGHENCSSDEVLHVAIKMGMTDLALLCVQHGSDLCSRDTHGRTALHLALLHANLQLVQHVANACKSSAPPRATDADNNQVEVLEGGDVAVEEASKEHLTLVESINQREGTTSESVLMMCLGFRHMELACSLLDAGASLSLTNIAGESPLHRMVHLVCREYFSRNVCRHVCSLALMSALLRIGGADPYLACEPEKSTPFHVVAWHGQEDAVLDAAKVLVEHNPELANARDRHGDSVLMCAIVRGNAKIAKLVIDAGCNVDVVNAKGNSALHVAVTERQVDLVKALLEHGAYPGVWDRQGMCPIHFAAGRGDAAIIEVFAEYCLQEGHLNYRTEDGLTPAMLAISHAQVESLQCLMQYNVDLRLVVPGSRQGVLHVALNTCLDENIEAAVKAELIDTLTSVDASELAMAQSFAGGNSTAADADGNVPGGAGGGKRMFSAPKCLEALIQMRSRLVTDIAADGAEVEEEAVASGDLSHQTSISVDEEKTDDEEEEEEDSEDGVVGRRMDQDFEADRNVVLSNNNTCLTAGEKKASGINKRAQELERVLDMNHREAQRAREVEMHGGMSEEGVLTAQENIKYQRVPIPYARNIPDEMNGKTNKKPIAGGARALLLGKRRESTMGGPNVRQLVSSMEEDVNDEYNNNIDINDSDASGGADIDDDNFTTTDIPRAVTKPKGRAMTASIKALSSTSALALNGRENNSSGMSIRNKLLSSSRASSNNAKRSALRGRGASSKMPTAFNSDGSAKEAANNVTVGRGARRRGGAHVSVSSAYDDVGSDTEDEMTMVLEGDKDALEHSSGFLESLSEEDYARILSNIRQEAQDTAKQWIGTKAGKRMLQRRAKELLSSGAASDSRDALKLAEMHFVREHVEDSLGDVQGMSEEMLKERVDAALESQASMVA